MIANKKTVPSYFTETKNILWLVIFTAVFGLAFVNIYNPFGWLDFYDTYSLWYFVYTSVLVLSGIVALTISRILMRAYAKRHPFYYIQYFVWLLGEVALLALLYSIISLVFKYDEFPGIYNVIQMYKMALGNVVLIIGLPYFISSLYFALQDKNKRLKQAENDKHEITHPLDSSVIVFRDDKGVFRISITIENIICLEAADNYVSIKYMNKGKTSDFLLRNTLRTLSRQLDKTAIVRCHRSYMVNFEHAKVIRRDKAGIYIEMDVEGLDDIPVSKTYNKDVTERFANYSSVKNRE